MHVNEVPQYDASDNPTNCCPRFQPKVWDDRELHFRDKRFVKATTKSVMHVPLNMGAVFSKTFLAITDAGADDPENVLVMSRDASPWRGEHLFAVAKDVPGEDMVLLSGDFRTKVFEGPYKQAGEWRKQLLESVSADQDNPPDVYFFYTTCPKCARHYGKNYVVGIVQDHSSAKKGTS